jgi:hypothetical protein
LNGSVSDLISLYKDHREAKVQLTRIAPKIAFKKYLRTVENQLACAGEHANRIEAAING